MKTLPLLALTLLLSACSQSKAKKSETLPLTLDEAIASSLRTPENTKRDVYRHPKETLEFFGLQNNMTVLEVTPGAGWYTEILAPLLVTNGKYIIAVPTLEPNSPEYARQNDQKVRAILSRHPEVMQKTIMAPFDPLNKDLTDPSTVDLVLTFRNVHNWLGNNSAQAAFNAFYRALKPGGTLGVVEHRQRNPKHFDPKSGYMTEKQVINLALKAGFKLADRSEINANIKDNGNHPQGVWTLPPSLRLGDKDRAKYEAIGESDRMTLKFVKPTK